MNNKPLLPVNYQFILKQKKQAVATNVTARVLMYGDDEMLVLPFYKFIYFVA